LHLRIRAIPHDSESYCVPLGVRMMIRADYGNSDTRMIQANRGYISGVPADLMAAAKGQTTKKDSVKDRLNLAQVWRG